MSIRHNNVRDFEASLLRKVCAGVHLADKIAQKHNQRYEDVTAYIRCNLSFMILKSALLCLRGSRKANTDCAGVDKSYFKACTLPYFYFLLNVRARTSK